MWAKAPRAVPGRLADVKAEYDPDDAFHHSKNIRPG
jgi:hypothetical protein